MHDGFCNPYAYIPRPFSCTECMAEEDSPSDDTLGRATYLRQRLAGIPSSINEKGRMDEPERHLAVLQAD